MILERPALEAKKVIELRQIAASMNIAIAQESKEQIIDRLMLEAATQPQPPAAEAKPQAEAEPAPALSIEDVKRACAPFILRGMKLYHCKEDDTWLFRVRIKDARIRDSNTGETRMMEQWREDSGTLRQPLEVIRRCASALMQRVAAPESEKPRGVSEKYEAVA